MTQGDPQIPLNYWNNQPNQAKRHEYSKKKTPKGTWKFQVIGLRTLFKLPKQRLIQCKPRTTDYVRGFRACPSRTSEHSSLHLRTGRSVVRGKPRLLRLAQSRWGFPRGVAVHYSTISQGGEVAALPFSRTRGFKPRVRYNLNFGYHPLGEGYVRVISRIRSRRFQLVFQS